MASDSRSNRLGDISVTYVAVMARTLESQGLASAPWLARYRMTRNQLATPGARISIPRFMRMGHDAISLTANPALGLEFAHHTRLSDMGMAGLAALCAPTLGEALRTLIRFERLTSYNSRGQSHWHPLPEGGALARFYSISPYNRYNLFVVDAILGGWLQFLQSLAGVRVCPLRVDIEYPEPEYAEQMQHWMGCPIQFEAKHNALNLPESVTKAANPYAEPALYRETMTRCEQALTGLESGWSILQRVRDQLTPQMRGQVPAMGEVAARIGTTEWGLRRELQKQGLTYRELLDETRSELARDYVRDTTLSFTDIADLLGFTNPSAFHRAFQRWFRCSPGDYRARHQHWR